LPLSGGTITGGTSFNSTISVAGEATFNGITANGNAVFNKSISIFGALAIGANGSFDIAGNTGIHGKISLNKEIIVGSSNYGTSLPKSGTVGQLFFKLI
jgi:hypothetical protein